MKFHFDKSRHSQLFFLAYSHKVLLSVAFEGLDASALFVMCLCADINVGHPLMSMGSKNIKLPPEELKVLYFGNDM